jgi:hypothetical protein
VLFLWSATTCMVFVASSLEEMTRCEEPQKDYKGEQSERWDDGHAESWSPRVAPAIRCSVESQDGLAVHPALINVRNSHRSQHVSFELACGLNQAYTLSEFSR